MQAQVTLSTRPLPGACAARHCQGPVIQGQFPQDNTGTSQAVATFCWPLTPQARPTFRTPPSPWPEGARAPYSAATLNTSSLNEEQDPSGDLHAEVGLNPKMNSRSCVNKDEKGNFSQQPEEQRIKPTQST